MPTSARELRPGSRSLGYFRGAREFFPQGTFREPDFSVPSWGAGICHGTCTHGQSYREGQQELWLERCERAKKRVRELDEAILDMERQLSEIYCAFIQKTTGVRVCHRQTKQANRERAVIAMKLTLDEPREIQLRRLHHERDLAMLGLRSVVRDGKTGSA